MFALFTHLNVKLLAEIEFLKAIPINVPAMPTEEYRVRAVFLIQVWLICASIGSCPKKFKFV